LLVEKIYGFTISQIMIYYRSVRYFYICILIDYKIVYIPTKLLIGMLNTASKLLGIIPIYITKIIKGNNATFS